MADAFPLLEVEGIETCYGLTQVLFVLSLPDRSPELPSFRIAQLGLGLVPEGRQIFPNLTVRENLVAACGNRLGSADPWTIEKIHALFPRLAERGSNMGATLSG